MWWGDGQFHSREVCEWIDVTTCLKLSSVCVGGCDNLFEDEECGWIDVTTCLKLRSVCGGGGRGCNSSFTVEECVGGLM